MESPLNFNFDQLFVQSEYPELTPPNINKPDQLSDSIFNGFDFGSNSDFSSSDYIGLSDPLSTNFDFSIPFFNQYQNYTDNTRNESNYDNTIKKFSNRKDFVNVLNEAYKKALKNNGLDESYSIILVAQDANETNYGKSVLGDYNFGNITTTGNDWHKKTGNRKWKDFNSIDDYANYKIKFLSNKRYNFFNTFSPNSSVSVSMQTLANRGYDPGNSQYGKRIQNTYNDVIKYLNKSSIKDNKSDLIKIDIEDLFKQEGLTSINGKKLRFGSKEPRPNNAKYGSSKSHHKEIDPHTGNANARDISITNGTTEDYEEFRKQILNNPRIMEYLFAKNWGILNELTLAAFKKYGSTGPHLHFGEDVAAIRTLDAWKNDPKIPVTQLI